MQTTVCFGFYLDLPPNFFGDLSHQAFKGELDLSIVVLALENMDSAEVEP